eukprot:COSAG01_NODE_156_length_23748_cov_439.062371_16_plen_94_part_00
MADWLSGWQGVAAVAIADAMNSEDPKGQIIELILTQVGGGGTTSSGTTSGGGGGAGAVAERVQAAAAPEPSLVPQVTANCYHSHAPESLTVVA